MFLPLLSLSSPCLFLPGTCVASNCFRLLSPRTHRLVCSNCASLRFLKVIHTYGCNMRRTERRGKIHLHIFFPFLPFHLTRCLHLLLSSLPPRVSSTSFSPPPLPALASRVTSLSFSSPSSTRPVTVPCPIFADIACQYVSLLGLSFLFPIRLHPPHFPRLFRSPSEIWESDNLQNLSFVL